MNTTTTRSKEKKEVRDLRAEAVRIANSQHVDGQTKEQTRLIAKGIQRGMEQYLRQQSEKSRELDKRVKKVKHLANSLHNPKPQVDQALNLPTKNSDLSYSFLPWVLLGVSWFIFFFYLWLRR